MTAVALTIAGSDSGGGAGIQADLKTFAALGVYGTSAITAVTAQNTMGVRAVHLVPPGMVAAQIAAVLDDFDVRAVKIGLVPAAAHVAEIADGLARRSVPVVLDPVMIASSGHRLMDADAVRALRERLLPRVACLTPNLPEAAALTGRDLAAGEAEMEAQGRALLAFGPQAVLVKGGHAGLGEAVDLLVSAQGVIRFAGAWIDSPNLHGTGCTLSSAIAAGLARGLLLEEAVERAKAYLTAAIAAGAGRRLGRGSGPLDHWPDRARQG
ncbi:bifunctional hydroxymethylpyrimidine kinase/phosphomethylpyrimidine kinase [Labrys monachus]|uniref:hydroxymethylpyrimidine kinase n=1 Tax=Labrys monachus TaxID=217067 RepID=A0ABU0FM16_9HYPH|nr:bifunctional hydroxymethylpyrimidine kinase/phosphomethylpyrimidine kinase [Labrys monachus]MDQ0395653.1 hydroxymethylpyrimidine/phosphomethylpyrimidine kinase [Labrys monachus]